MFTMWRASFEGRWFIVPGAAGSAAVIVLLHGSARLIAFVAVWVAVLVWSWLALWRYCHPIRQWRFEWAGYRHGLFRDSVQSQGAWIRAWEQTGGNPPARPSVENRRAGASSQ